MKLKCPYLNYMIKTLTKYLMLAMTPLLPSLGNAEDFNKIKAANTGAVVYIQIEDSKGKLVSSGTGFIVSSDGYVVTVEHLKVEADQQMWAVIGQRHGTRLPLAYREKDEENDVALWQLPQSNSCRQSAILSNIAVQNYPEPALALGFPGTQGLTPIPLNILNRSPEHDFYKTDGYLEHGDSGGPVFNGQGRVVAIVQGGTLPGTKNNDLIPISLAINLINKRGVMAGIDSPASCENEARKSVKSNSTKRDLAYAQKAAIIDQIKRIITADRESSDVNGCATGTKFDLVLDRNKIRSYSCAHVCFDTYWTVTMADLDFEKITVQANPQLPQMGWVTVPCIQGKCVFSKDGQVGPGTMGCTRFHLEESVFQDEFRLWVLLAHSNSVMELLKQLSPTNATK